MIPIGIIYTSISHRGWQMKRGFLLVVNFLLVITMLLPSTGLAQPMATPDDVNGDAIEITSEDSLLVETPAISSESTEVPAEATDGFTEDLDTVETPVVTIETTPDLTPEPGISHDEIEEPGESPTKKATHTSGEDSSNPDTPLTTEPTAELEPTAEISGTPDTNPSISANATNPRMKLSEISGPAGMEITADGTGYDPDSPVTVRFNGVTQTFTDHSNDMGEFSVSITIPTEVYPGDKIDITVSTYAASQTAVFTIFNPQGVELTVEPNSGYAGSTVTLTGRGFEENGWVTILWNDNDLGEQLGYVPTSRDGEFEAEIRIPAEIPRGNYTIYAMDQSMQQASVELSVVLDVTIKVSPTTGMPGERITVSGTGFLPGERVNIRWGGADGRILGYKNATPEGTFIGVMLVPADAAAGDSHIYLQQPDVGSASSPFTVIAPPAPTMSVSPTSGLPGARLSVSGTNFNPGERVNIRWGSANGKILGYKNATSTGTFSGVMLVPADAAAGNSSIYLQSASGTASASFTVVAPPAPTATVSPASGRQGDRLTVSGTNFASGERVNIRWGSSSGPILGYKVANSNGTISGAILVPAIASAGTSHIYLQSASGTASGTFTVTTPPSPTAAVSPTSGLPGARLSVSGTNFRPGERVNIRWGNASGNILGYVIARSDGTVRGAILVPANASAGSTRIYLQSASATTYVPLSVQPKPRANVSLSYNWGTYGDVVGIQGWNFQPGETVTITFPGNTVVGRVTVRSDGTFSGRVAVPKGAAVGYNTITSRGGSSGSSAGIRFEVFEYLETDVAVTSRALPGAVIEFAGNWFRPGETVTIYWSDFSVLGSARVQTNGGISGYVRVPAYAPAGYHVVGFSNPDGTYVGTTTITVVPIVAPYISGPGNGVSGRSVTITGAGFGPNERVLIGDVQTLEDVAIAYTNAAGEFVAYGTIPYGFNRPTAFMAIGTTTELWATMEFFIIVSIFPLDTPKYKHAPDTPHFQQWSAL